MVKGKRLVRVEVGNSTIWSGMFLILKVVESCLPVFPTPGTLQRRLAVVPSSYKKPSLPIHLMKPHISIGNITEKESGISEGGKRWTKNENKVSTLWRAGSETAVEGKAGGIREATVIVGLCSCFTMHWNPLDGSLKQLVETTGPENLFF